MTDTVPLVRALLDATTADTVAIPRAWVEALLAPAVPSAGLTVAQVAAQLRRGESTIRTLCGQGQFPGAFRLRNRGWLIPPDGLTAFLEQQQAHHSAPEPDTPRRSGKPADLSAWRKIKGAA